MTNDSLLRTLIRPILKTFRLAAGNVLAALALLLMAGAAQATTYTFDGNLMSSCPTYDSSSKTYTCATLPSAAGTEVFVIADGYTVVVTSNVSFSNGQSFQMSGAAKLQSSGSIDLSVINPSNLNISNGTLVASNSLAVGTKLITANITASSLTGPSNTKLTGSLTISGGITVGSSSVLNGNISAASLKTDSGTSITGNITATGSVDLGSASTVKGNITAPQVTLRASPTTVTGNIAASNSLSMESGATVNGNVTGGSLKMAPSPAVINGNATMTGDVEIGSGDSINGNLSARNVVTKDSSTSISGNVAVSTIALGYSTTIGKTLYCVNSPPSSPCSCVISNAGGNPAPTCTGGSPPPTTPPAASGPDHILITHSGSALTCQPQTVSLTACANAACTSNYASSTTVTLSPGSQSVTFTGTGTGTVSQSTVGNATLSATGTGITNASTCSNTGGGTSCSMTFATAGLDFPVPDQFSEVLTSFTLRALKADGSNACVPALANTSQVVKFTCSYANPSTGTLPLRISGTALAGSSTSSCSAAGANVTLAFNANGQATPTVQYADVGTMNLNASMTLNGATLSNATAVPFTVAPAKFLMTAFQGTVTNPGATDGTGSPFIAAGKPFSVLFTAANALNATTPNFGHESTPESATWTGSLLAPSSGTYPVISPATPVAMSNGQSTTDNIIFNEVGVLKLTASLVNTNGYLNKSALKPTGTVNIGRFYPDHFNTVLLNPNLLMSCSSAASCPANYNAGAGTMAYSKQPFDISVTAYSANGQITTNYTNSINPGGFSRAVTISAVDATSGVTNPPATTTGNAMAWKTSAGVTGTANFTATQFLNGVASSAASGSTSHPEYDFGASYSAAAPATAVPAPTTIFLRATETAGDGVTSLRATGTTEATLSILSGRLQVVNNYGTSGSSSPKMPVKVRAQYWNGTGWVLNPAFPYPAVAPATPLVVPLTGLVTISNCQFKSASVTCPTMVTSPAQSLTFGNSSDGLGNASFYLNPMSAAGSADLLVSPLIYLPSTTGRATFGVYRSGPLIYIREVF